MCLLTAVGGQPRSQDQSDRGPNTYRRPWVIADIFIHSGASGIRELDSLRLEFRQALLAVGDRDAQALAQLNQSRVPILSQRSNQLFGLPHDITELFGQRRTLRGSSLQHLLSPQAAST